MTELEDNIRSEEVEDILGNVPSWFTRWGSTIILAVIVITIIISFIIKYPDIIVGRVSITTNNPPARLIAQANGRIHLYIKNNQNVNIGDFVAIIENSAIDQDIFKLKQDLIEFQTISNNPNLIVNNKKILDENLNLGELQSYYVTFKDNCKKYLLLLKLNQRQNQISSFYKQKNHYSSLQTILEKKKSILSKDLQIVKKQFRIDSILKTQKVISDYEFEKSESNYFKALHSFESCNEELLQNELLLESLNQKITEAEILKIDEKTKAEEMIQNSLKDLESKFEIWKQKYVLIAPVDGYVTFYTYWHNNQYVSFGEEVLTIITQSKSYFGKIESPAKGFGKVKTGQSVRILLDNYPHEEFGTIKGIVINTSDVSRHNTYIININLPEGLISNYKKKFEFKQEMQGTAEIITEDLSLIERFFYQLKQLFKNN